MFSLDNAIMKLNGDLILQKQGIPMGDNCGVCVDETHVADWAFPLREGEIDGKTFHGRYPTRLC